MDTAVQSIDARLDEMARDVVRLRRELHQLRAAAAQHKDANGAIHQSRTIFADKSAIREAFSRLRAELGIEREEPMGIEALQKLMAEARLGPNELSRGIIKMREE
jgi:uncharacterized protein YicC (UPF0701 family)